MANQFIDGYMQQGGKDDAEDRLIGHVVRTSGRRPVVDTEDRALRSAYYGLSDGVYGMQILLEKAGVLNDDTLLKAHVQHLLSTLHRIKEHLDDCYGNWD